MTEHKHIKPFVLRLIEMTKESNREYNVRVCRTVDAIQEASSEDEHGIFLLKKLTGEMRDRQEGDESLLQVMVLLAENIDDLYTANQDVEALKKLAEKHDKTYVDFQTYLDKREAELAQKVRDAEKDSSYVV